MIDKGRESRGRRLCTQFIFAQGLDEVMSPKGKKSPDKTTSTSPVKKNAPTNDSGSASTAEHLIKLLLIGDSGNWMTNLLCHCVHVCVCIRGGEELFVDEIL